MAEPKPGTAKLPDSSRSVLAESSKALRDYLYLAKSTNIDDILSLRSGNNAQIQARDEELKRLTRQRALYEIVLENSVATLKNRKETAESKTPAPGTPQNAEPSVVSIPLKNYGHSLPDFDGEKNKIGTTDISILSIINTAKGLNFSSRSSEYVAIFSNLMPTVELSKCVPYLTIKFIQNVSNRNNVSMPFLTLDSFLGSARAGSALGVAKSDNIVPDSSIYSLVENPTGRVGGTVTGMEIFQAPQTLVRPHLDKTPSYAGSRGVPVLDPMVPLLSIESINFDVSALSQNFMTTQTKIDLSLILHDRSRLMEISPLVSPGVYPTVKVEVEWGWVHPDSSQFSVNPYAKFLNALRSKQVFGLVGSSFSNRDSNSLSIKLQLMGLGEFMANSTSILAGRYVPYELLRAKMNQLFNIVETTTDGTKTQNFVGAYEQPVVLSNWETGDKWINYSDYKQINTLIENAGGYQEDKIREIIEAYQYVLTNRIVATQTTNDVVSINPTTTFRNDLVRELGLSDLSRSPYINTLYAGLPGLQEQLKEIATTAARDTGIQGSEPLYALGDLIYRLYCAPIGITGTFDEIRVNIFDFNDHAGQMSGLNIGAFVLSKKTVNEEVIKPKMTAQKALQRLLGLVNSPTAAAYGVKQSLLAKRELEEQLSKEDDPYLDGTAEPKSDAKKVQEQYEIALKKIYDKNVARGIGGSYEPKFVPPRVKAHTEVTFVKDGDVYKQVLNVFIYDESNSGTRSVDLLMSISQVPGGRVKLLKAGDNAIPGFLNYTQNPDGSLIVTADRQTAKNAITAAVPTLRIGSEGSVITSATYSSTGGGDLVNINLLKGFQNSGGNTRADTTPGLGVDMFVIPATVNLSMIGMPLLNRGQMYYIDFGTGTTLDNVYTVTSVKHSMKGGQFTTSATLNPINTGSIKSVTTALQNDLDALTKYKKTMSVKPP